MRKIRTSGLTRAEAVGQPAPPLLHPFLVPLRDECFCPSVPLSLEDARRLVEGYVRHYNEVRLHNAIGYLTPADKLAGRDLEIFAERDRKLEAAREQRRIARETTRQAG